MEIFKKNLIIFICISIMCLSAFGCGKKSDKVPDGEFNFKTKTIDGDSISFSEFSDAKVVMINFWEPWCGPCVGEMPDLEKLYEKYKDEGFVIIGAFSDTSDINSAKKVVKDCNITYPIIQVNDDLNKYEQPYVPSTIFVDGNGNILTKDSYIGAYSYNEWEYTILQYLHAK